MNSYYQLEPLMERLCVEDNDRISHLPDDVISKILNFVTSTKYAYRTSVLSKHWEHLWALSSKIIFEIELTDQYNMPETLHAITLTNSVDKLLFLRDGLHIEYFKLLFIGELGSFLMHASSWVCAVVMCNVRELDVHIKSVDTDLLELPWCLFTCKTLVVLKLSGKFILNVPHCVCLPNLKTLYLGFIIYMGDEEIHKLLSGCPVLEDLTIFRYQWDQTWTLNVNVSSLKRLTFCSFPEDDYPERVCRHKIMVDAPSLEFIEITDERPNDIVLKALPNKVEKFLVLFRSIVNVKRLFIDHCTFLILDEDFEFALPRFCNLVFMELDYINGPFRLMEFLRSSPNLEALSFPWGFNYPRTVYPDVDYDEFIDREFLMNDPEGVPECLRNSLKIVEIKCFKGQEVEYNLVTYLLENAMVLEKMTIFICRDAKIDELQTDLTNHPRRSTNCQLEFKLDPIG